MERIEITVLVSNVIRASIINEKEMIDDIIEHADAVGMADDLMERGLAGTGVRIFAGEVELDVGELSLSEDLEIVQLNNSTW